MSEARVGLDVEQRRDRDTVTLTLGGELDIAGATRLQATVAQVCADGRTRALTLDMRELAFIDSSGLAAIVYASRLCERHGCELALIAGAESVQRVFEITGLAAVLPFRERDA